MFLFHYYDTQHEEEGVALCLHKTAIYTCMHTHNLRFFFSDAPEITSDGEITVVEGSGETATLDFVIDANPPSDTNTISSSSTSSVPSSLSINENNTVVVSESVTRSDSGQYIFVSRNSIGESSAVFTLDVQCKCVYTVLSFPPSTTTLQKQNCRFNN